jgi:hypothetical protein
MAALIRQYESDWQRSKIIKETTLYSRKNPDEQTDKGAVSFRAETDFDCPPHVLAHYSKDFAMRKQRDDDFD